MEYIKEGKKCNRITEDGKSKELEKDTNESGHTVIVMHIIYVCVDNRERERER